MPFLFTATRVGGGGINYGDVYEKPDGGGAATVRDQDVQAYPRRTQILAYRRRTYMIGTFNRPRVRDEFGNYRPAGVRQPLTKISLGSGGGSGSVGEMIGYQTFVVKQGNVLIAESNPGVQSDTFSNSGVARLWDDIDWEPQDAAVTHVRLYVSVDGRFPALAAELPLAAAGTTYTESVPTAGLGVTLPVRKGLDQQFALDTFARGVPPYTKFAEVYHDAFFYAGDPVHPERIYYSKLFEPDAVNTTPIIVNGREDIPWLVTTDGQPVTGIKRCGDELIVGKPRGIDRIQGYSYSDYVIHEISNYWGVTSHFSMRRCGPLSSLFFAAPQGPTIYNAGSFRFIGDRIQSWWRDQLRANPAAFEDAFGVEDRFWETYNLLLPGLGPNGGALWLVVDYNFAEAGRPIWVFDKRERYDWVSEEMPIAATTQYFERYTASCDGKVHQENVENDADDNGDAYQKRMVVQPPHRYMRDQGGDAGHGWVFNPADLYVKHEVNDVLLSFYAGEDDAFNAAQAHCSKTLPSTGAATGQRTRTAVTSERVSLQGVSGKGVSMLLECVAPLGVEYRGVGLDYRKGPAPKQPYE